MSYRFGRSESVQQGVRRIACEQIDKAIQELDSSSLDRAVIVHQVRKRCKKLRALVRIVRPCFDGYDTENACFRDAARSLSGLRDAAAMFEAFDAVVDATEHPDDVETLCGLRQILETQIAGRQVDHADMNNRLDAFRRTMVTARGRAERWTIDAAAYKAISGGLKKTYGRGRDALRAVRRHPTTERLHEWRKRVKYHWQHTRLLADIWQPMMQARAEALSTLSDLLGDDHDLAVLRAAFIDHGSAVAAHDALDRLIERIDDRRTRLKASAVTLGQHLYAEKPAALSRRFAVHWNAWRDTRALSLASETAAPS